MDKTTKQAVARKKRNYILILIIILAIVLIFIGSSVTGKAIISEGEGKGSYTKNGILYYNNKAIFPIGIWIGDTPTYEVDGKRHQTDLTLYYAEFKQNGINTVLINLFNSTDLSQTVCTDIMNRIENESILVIAGGYYVKKIGVIEEEEEELKKEAVLFPDEKIKQQFNCYKQYNNFLGWFGADEPAVTLNKKKIGPEDVPLEIMKKAYRQHKEIDPNHIVWVNHALSTPNAFLVLDPATMCAEGTDCITDRIHFFNKYADVSGFDVYPLPEGKNAIQCKNDTTFGCIAEKMGDVGKFTRRYVARRKNSEQPVWAMLQAFDGDRVRIGPKRKPVHLQGNIPTYEQARFMAYDTIVNGATGIFWWGLFAIPYDSEAWNSVMDVSKEISEKSNILLAETLPTNWDNKNIRILTKKYNKKIYVFMVNEADEPQTVSVRVKEEIGFTPIYTFKKEMAPYEVYIHEV